MAPLHRLTHGVGVFEMAILVFAVLLLAIVYVTFSKTQRPRRLPMLVCACSAASLTVLSAINLLSLDTDGGNWPGIGTQVPTLPTFSTLQVVPACLTAGIILVLCLNATVAIWRTSHWVTRTTLVSGSLTLVNASVSVAAVCIAYATTSDSMAVLMTNLSIVARDLAIAVGIIFGSILVVFVASWLGREDTEAPSASGGGSEM